MIAIETHIVEAAIKKFEDEIDEFSLKAKSNLQALLDKNRKSLNAAEIKYLEDLIPIIQTLVKAKPEVLKSHRDTFGEVPIRIIKKPKEVKGVMVDEEVNDYAFRDSVLGALNYTALRKNFFASYFAKIGIKSCVYCNALSTVSVNSYPDLTDKTKFTVRAKFQLDHSIPQSKYPSLSISLYNLYPVCGPCNNIKGVADVKFTLYSDDHTLSKKSEYSFKLINGSVSKYLRSRKTEDIKIKFSDPHKSSKSTVSESSFQDTFDIEGIYEMQKDIAEELIVRAEIYNDSYRKKLAKSFPKIFTNASLSNRLIVGNYTAPHEIHNRPMAKFMQDIARQLKLID